MFGSAWRICVLAQVVRLGAIYDDDCELASDRPRRRIDWRGLRDGLADGNSALVRPLLDTLRQHIHDPFVRAECPLGVAAVCLALASSSTAGTCLEGFSLSKILASRWPLFQMLAEMQHRIGSHDKSCIDTSHPSLAWGLWLANVTAFVEIMPLWIKGFSKTGDLPAEYNHAINEAQGIFWKASSKALVAGRTISEWTGDCPLGLLCALAIRMVGHVLGDWDVHRSVQRSLEHLQGSLLHVEEILNSAWPIYGVLHTLGLVKTSFYDARLTKEDVASDSAMAPRSEIRQLISNALRRAAAVVHGLRAVIATAVGDRRSHLVGGLFSHAAHRGFLGALVVVPLSEEAFDRCHAAAAAWQSQVAGAWAPCLPVISSFQSKAQWLYIHLALQLDIATLWFDVHVVWLRSPLEWLGRLLAEPGRAPQYHHPCRQRCAPETSGDVFLVDEFYAAYWPRSSLLLLRPTPRARRWAAAMLEWLCTYAFANARRGLRYLAHADKPDIVPSISMLPERSRVPQVTVVELDAEQLFVSSDGWFGHVEEVIAYEVGSAIVEEERLALLNMLWFGDEESVREALLLTRKSISPLRPAENLHRMLQNGAATPAQCKWEPAAFMSMGAQRSLEGQKSFVDAKCECVAIGHECGGVVCVQRFGAKSIFVRGDRRWKCAPVQDHAKLTGGRHLRVYQFAKHCADGGFVAPLLGRLVHVSFASGCCQMEQAHGSKTALAFGADESRALSGDALDLAFKRRNKHLLKFNRTAEMTRHKTPSGGYLIWKPYVILKTLEDEALPWDTTVVVYADAGAYFVNSVRPLVRKYLLESDVSAARSTMPEGGFSKRDAFVLLDADYQSIMETNQVAAGFILVRKTRLAVTFLRHWLRACENPQIITEQPSRLGLPESFLFKNNNDDQTAFSLLFKKYGFVAFSIDERDHVLNTQRNRAKFAKASDDFVRGLPLDREAYLRAADDVAINLDL